MLRRFGALLTALLASAIAGCSGGSHAAPVLSTPTREGANVSAVVSFSIPKPIAASGARRATYVSPLSSTLNYSATNGTATATGSVTNLTPYCTTGTTSLACSVPISAPIGSDTFTISLLTGGTILSTHTTTTPVPITEGSLNAVPPMVLDPVAATMSVGSVASVVGSTAAVAVPLTIADAASQTVVGLGTYVIGLSDAPGAFQLTTSGSANGIFSTSASCSSPATSFTPWTVGTALYFCPQSTVTLGTTWTATLDNATTTFTTRRTGQSTSGATTTGGSATTNYLTPQWIAGAESINHFTAAGDTGGNYYVYVGNYTGQSWAFCSGVSAPAVLDDATGSTLLAVVHGTAQLYKYTYNSGGNTCTSTGSYASTQADIVSLVVDPNHPTLAYGPSSDFSSIRTLRQIDMTSLALANASVNCGTQTSNNATYPTSVAVGPNDTLYVGCYNGLSVSSYALSPTFVTTPTVHALGSAPDTGMWVAANADVAYAVGVDASSKNITIYTVAAASAAMSTATYTDPTTTDALTTGLDTANQFVGNPLVVGDDDRLYLVVNNGTVNRVIAYDPYSATLTDPALALPTVVNASTLQGAGLSLAPSGKLLVGGYDTSSNVLSAATWPN